MLLAKKDDVMLSTGWTYIMASSLPKKILKGDED